MLFVTHECRNLHCITVSTTPFSQNGNDKGLLSDDLYPYSSIAENARWTTIPRFQVKVYQAFLWFLRQLGTGGQAGPI
jgi:hypothetical protein